MKILSSLGRIIKGYYRWWFKKRSALASGRLIICSVCTYRAGFLCGKCFCELHAKASLEEEHCPVNNW